jgi:phenylpropionate dioxygenase-like ring-hydroxylating dioxygenase large terminal subunit
MDVGLDRLPSPQTALDALSQIVARGFAAAIAMPGEVYASEAFLALERERIFRKEWICIGRSSIVSQPGDFVTGDIDGQPIVVLRDQAMRIRAFSNVCRHRMSVLLEGRGNVKVIVCPYHAWSYNLDGTLRRAPMMERNTEFCKSDCRLPELRCEPFEGFVYVTLDDQAEPIAQKLKPLQQLVAHYGMSDYVETFREEHIWNTNWKLLAENFMESYHLPMLHKATVGPHSKLEEMECPPGLDSFNYHWITKEASLPIGNAHPDNRRLEGHWRKTTGLLAIYPSHLITLTPGYFWYLVLQPQGIGKVRMIFGGGLSPDFVKDEKGADYIAELKKLLDEVNREDRRGVEAVFRGVQAPLARPGPLSHLERPNYDFARYLAKMVSAAE